MNLLGLGNLGNERYEDTLLFLILLLFFLTPTTKKCYNNLGDDVGSCGDNGFADSYGEYSILILVIILQFLR